MRLIEFFYKCYFVKLFLIVDCGSVVKEYLINQKAAENTDFCTNDNYGDTTWKTTPINTCTISDPLCINNNLEIVQRCCSEDGTFQDKPNCFLQLDISMKTACPEGFINTGSSCIIIINDSTYPPICPYPNTLAFEEYIKWTQYFSKALPVWIPAQRDTAYGNGPFYWTEKNSLYKTPVNLNIIPMNSKHSCLVYHNSTAVVPVSCKESYNAICAYKYIYDDRNSWCSQKLQFEKCVQSDYSNNSICFCLDWNNNSTSKKAEFLYGYQNLLFLTNETCLIGLEKKDDIYIWSNSNIPLSYANWSPKATFGNNLTIGAYTSEGWILITSVTEANCSLIETNIAIDNDSYIYLKYDEDSKVFLVNVSNSGNWFQNENDSYPLIFCFTDASEYKLIDTIEFKNVESQEYSILFYFEPYFHSGNYWCEGLVYPNLETKKSNSYLLRNNQEEYVVLLKTYLTEQTDPSSEENLKNLQSIISTEMQNDASLSTFIPRIYKIVSINENDSSLIINFHISNSVDSNIWQAYSQLAFFFSSTKLGNFKFEDFLSADQCIGFHYTIDQKSVMWPAVPIGQVALQPSQDLFCVGPDEHILHLYCEGNFIDGGNWVNSEDIMINCSYTQSTNTSVNLTNIINIGRPQEYLEQVHQLVANSESFFSYDVFLVTKYLRQLTDTTSINSQVLNIIDILMDFPEQVLIDSQREYGAVEEILESITKLLFKIDSFVNVTTVNWKILELDKLENLKGVYLVENNEGYILKPIFDKNSDETYIAAIDFSEAPQEDIERLVKSESKIFIIASLTRNLFVSSGCQTATNPIFNILIPNFEEHFNYIVRYNVSSANTPICGIHNLETSDGDWSDVKQQSMLEGVLICNYNLPNKYVSLLNNKNITEQLEEILNEEDCHIRLARTEDLLDNCRHLFLPVDLKVLSNILHKSGTSVEQPSFYLTVEIINFIMDITSNILETAQEMFKATSSILEYFNSVLLNTEFPINDSYSNLYIRAYDYDHPLIKYVVVNYCDHSGCRVYDSTEIESCYPEDDVCLTLGKETFLSTPDHPHHRLIFNFLYTDIMDTQSDDNQYLRTITGTFGVFLPDFHNGHFDGGVKIQFKIPNSTTIKMCGLWVVSQNDRSSYWITQDSVLVEDNKINCTYDSIGYYAALEFDLTSYLNIIITSSEDIENIFEKVNDVINRYKSYIKGSDILMLVQLFEKISKVDENLLKITLNLIDIITSLNQEILIECQKNYNSTDIILNVYNNLIRNYTEPFQICKENIALFILNLNEDNTTLVQCGDEWNITIVLPMIYVSQKQSSVKIRLSSPLLQEIMDNNGPQLLALTIFSNNLLFIGEETSYTEHKDSIFGIHFPYFTKPLPDKLKIYFNSSYTDCYCAWWQSNINGTMSWSYSGLLRYTDYSCTFFEQGFFTLTASTYYMQVNITQELNDIQTSQQTLSEKLYRLDAVCFQRQSLLPKHLSVISDILQQCETVDTSDLDSIAIILNNLLEMDRNTLHASQTRDNSLNKILEGATCLAGKANEEHYSFESGNFWLLICHLKDSPGALISISDIRCISSTKNDENEFKTVVSAVINEDVRKTILINSSNAKFVVSVFHNNAFFAETINDTSIVLGFSVPSLEEIPNGGLNVIFHNDPEYKHMNNCGYWNYVTNTKAIGQWFYSDTNYTDSQIKCEYSEPEYYSLVKIRKTTNLTQLLLDILESEDNDYGKVENTRGVVRSYLSLFESIHVNYVAKILSSISISTKTDLECLADLIDGLMEISNTILSEAQENYNATDEILYNWHRIGGTYNDGNMEHELINFAVLIIQNVTAIVVENCEYRCDIRKITEDISLPEFETSNIGIDTGLYIGNEIREKLIDLSTYLMFTVFYKNNLFNEGPGQLQSIVGNIIGVTILQNEDEFKKSFWFYDNTNLNSSEICSVWNYTINGANVHTGEWSQYSQASGSKCESINYSSYFALLEDDHSNVTDTLKNILESTASLSSKLTGVIHVVSEKTDKLSPVDIFLIAEILADIHILKHTTVKEMNLTSRVISELFNVDRSVLRESQARYNATDKILFSVDVAASKINHTDAQHNLAHDNFIMNSFDLKKVDVKGIALEDCLQKECKINISFTNITDILYNENLFAALILSEELLEQIKEVKNSKLIINVYFQDDLFNEEVVTNRSTGMIFGVILPGLNQSLKGKINVIYNSKTFTNLKTNNCSYWNYQVHIHNNIDAFRGYWQDDRNPEQLEQTVICEFDHITHFALLLATDPSTFGFDSKVHILDIINQVNCVLSLGGILGIILTAILFEKWRKNPGNQVLVNFSIAISLKIIMLYMSTIVAEYTKDKILCCITGAVLHYSLLSEFCWMLIIAILQFKRFVEVLGGPPKYILLKSCVCGWIFPTFPVITLMIIDPENYYESSVGLCYPTGYGLYLGVWLPLIIIITINFVIFIFIIYNIFHKKTEFKEQINYEILFQWRLALLLFSMLGLTWFFGFISIIGGDAVFVYLFCFIASLQGFIMFMFFILFNKTTRTMYSQKFKTWLYNNGYKYD